MLLETRRRRLLDLIARQGFATLDELVKVLDVSESTVRRDLEALDLAGSVKRTHGGAVYSGEVRTMPALEDRAGSATLEKQAIGRATAALIEDGDSVLLDGGTTTLEVARALLGRPLQVVTNSLPIAQLLSASKDIDLIMIGGYIYPRTGVALDPWHWRRWRVFESARRSWVRGAWLPRGSTTRTFSSWKRSGG